MGALRPLNEIMPQQQYQQQAPAQQAPQQYQQMPVQQVPQQQAQGNTYTMPLQTEAQLAQMQNNGRVEIVVQDANQGYQVISSDQLDIAAIERQNAQLGQELRLFDTNNDGWLVEAELKSTAVVGQAPAEKNSLAEDLAIGAIGGAISGGVVSKIPLLKKIPAAIGSKLGISGTLAGMATGAVIGLAGSWISRSGNNTAPQQASGPAGYRPETQWQNQRLVKTVL